MKRIILFFLINSLTISLAKANDTIPKIRKLRTDEILLSVSVESVLFGTYHSIGYARSYQLKGNSYLGFYFGVGYLPPKSEQLFADKLGFKGDRLYAHTARLQFMQKQKKLELYAAIEYNYLESTANATGHFDYERHFMGKVGTKLYLFKRHLFISPQFGLGLAKIRQAYTPVKNRTQLSFGFDLGFCF
jgi:hypothetical protein